MLIIRNFVQYIFFLSLQRSLKLKLQYNFYGRIFITVLCRVSNVIENAKLTLAKKMAAC